jgi:hypothetical protein
LLKHIFMTCTVAGCKRVPERKSEPSCKYTALDLEMICKYEGRQSLSGIAREPGFVVSTVNTMVKDAACIEEHVKGAAQMKSVFYRPREPDGSSSEAVKQ